MIMNAHESRGSMRQLTKVDKRMEKSPRAIVHLPRESIPYLPYIKRINLSFKVCASQIFVKDFGWVIIYIIRRRKGMSINQ